MDTIELPPMDITPDEKKPRKAFTDVQNLMNRQKEKYSIRTVEGLNDEQLAEYDKDPAAYEERELREQSRDIQSVGYDDIAEATFAEEENEYDKVAKDLYGSNRAVIDTSLDNAIKKNSKQTAEVLKLSDELKVSPDFVERNLDEVRAISKKNKIDVGDLQANYPAMAKYLSNPDNAALSIEDIEHLKRIELAAREIGPNSLRRSAPLQLWDALASGKKVDEDLEWMAKTTAGLSKAGLRITKGITQFPALAEAMAIYPINSYLENIDPALSGTVKPTRALMENPITRFLDKRIGALSTPESERSVIDLIQEGKIADAMETTWYQATEQIPQVGLMVLMSAKYGSQALASLAGISAVEGYDEGIREGKSPKDATRQALGYGIFEYAGERVTMGLLNSTRNRIIKEISKDATAKERIKNGLTTWFKEVSKDAVEEGVAEGFTTLGQNFTDYMTGDKAAMDNAVKDVINSAIIGGVVGGGIGAVSATSGVLDRGDYPDDPTAALDQATNEAANAYQSQKEIDKLKEIGEVMQEMGPTLDRPGAIEELVDKVTEGDEDAGSVYFQKDDWDSFWDKKGKDGDFLAQTISEEVQREYEEAKEHGGQIEVPLGKFVERFGNTQEYQELLEIVKTRADGYKSPEAKERIANLNKLMNELDKEANAEAEADEGKSVEIELKNTAAFQSSATQEQIDNAIIENTKNYNNIKNGDKLYDENGDFLGTVENQKIDKQTKDNTFNVVNEGKTLFIHDPKTTLFSKIVRKADKRTPLAKTRVEIKEQVKNSGYGDPETITSLMAARYVVRSKITGKDEYTLWTEDNIKINRVSDESQLKESPEERRFRQEKRDDLDTSRSYFHGGPQGIERFKTNKSGINKYLEGVYLAKDRNRAEIFSDNIKSEKGAASIYEVIFPRDEFLLDLDNFESVLLKARDYGLPEIKYTRKWKFNPEMDSMMYLRTSFEEMEGRPLGNSLNERLRDFLISKGVRGLKAEDGDIVSIFNPDDVLIKEKTYYQESEEDNPLGFYSELSRFVESAPFKKPQTKKQWKDLLNSKIQKGELKKSEVDYYTNELLEVDDGEKITKEDFLSFIEQKQAETELVEFRRGENLEGLEEVQAGEGWEHNLDYFADGDDFNYDNNYTDDELERTVEKLAEDEDNFSGYIEDVEQRLMEDGDVEVDEIYMGKYETYQDYDAVYEIEFEKILSEQIAEETKGKELTEDERDQIEADLRDSLESDDYLVRDSILDGINRGKYSIDIDPRTNPRADQAVESLARDLLESDDGDWHIYYYAIESGNMESGDIEVDYVVRGNDNIGWEVTDNYGSYEGSYDSIEEITESFREHYDYLKKEQAPDFDMEDSDDRIFYTGEMKFGDMQRARLGETNKREFLLSMPSFDTQFNAHWDEPNVVVHSRGGDLAHPILGKTLHIDEIQADPAKKRFKGSFKNPYLKSEDWALLAFKRLLKIAIDEGHDTITWANGLNVLDRNSTQLRELVDEVEWSKREEAPDYSKEDGILIPTEKSKEDKLLDKQDGLKVVTLYKNKNQKYKFTIDETGKIISSSVNDAIGKPFTEIIPNKKIVNEILASEKGKIGQDKIQVGGKGYTGLYNDILPKVVEKYLKKFDKTIKVEQATHGLVKNDKKDQLIQEEVFAVRLTDKLRNEILTKGQPLFQDKRGQIRIGDNYYYIDLFKNADFTTLLHEFGHSWLDMIRKDYDYVTSLEGELTPIQKRFIKDAEALMKEFGVESLADVTVENHELFARWTEAYMMEGKSPSPELKSVFHRFKAYLLSIYKKLENLNAPLTDEVRGIFDRLISLDAHKDAQDFAPLFNENTVVGMTPSDAEKYMVAMGEAEEDAEKEMLNQAMADHRRKQDKAYKKELKETTDEVIEELKNEGIHRVMEFLKETPMSKESLQEVVPGNELQDYKKYYTNKPEGLALGIVADMFGYPTGAELIEAIKSAPDINELADFLAKQRLESQEDASLASDEQLESIARKAIHNDGRAKLLQLEMELLRKNNPSVFGKALEATIARTPKLKEVKEQAQKIIDNKKIKEIKPFKYYNAERAAAKAAGKAFRKGDFQEAFNQKRNELLNHELYRAAVKAKDTETKIKKDFKKLNKPDKKLAKNRDINFINAARAILDPYGMLPKSIKPMDSLGLLKRYDPDAYDAIKSLIDSATFDKTDLKELTFAELQQMADTIKALWDMSKQSMNMDIDGKEKSKAEIKQELMDQIDELDLPKHEIGYKKAATTWEKAKIGLMGMRSALRRVESWVDAMDIKWGGPFRKYIWNPVAEAAENFRTKKNDYSIKFKNIMEKYKDNITFKPIVAGELGYTFKDKAELLGAMLHIGNGSNKKKLLAGRGWGDIREDGTLNSQKWDGFIDRMIKQGVLNKKDYDMLQEIWDLFEELKPDAQKAHKRLYGFFFNEITAEPIETPFGKYRGGYAPALTDSILVEDQKIREDKEIFESEGNAFMFPQTSKGFTISRIESYTAPLVMDLRLFPQHLDKVLRFTYIQPVVSDVASLVNDKEFRDKLHKIDPTIASEMLIPWLQRSVQQRVETPAKGRGWQAVSSIAKALRTNTGLNIMFGNLTNTLQQFTGISIAAVKVKKRLLRDALWEVTRNSKKVTESINDKSQFMKNRNATQLMDVNKRVNEIILNPTKYDKAKEWAREHGYFMQQFTQGIVDNIVWLGAYNQAVEEGMSEKDAVRFADSTVRETQGSFDPEAVSEFETGTAFRRFFTMFYSYFNMQANLLGSEFAKIQRERGLRKGLGRGLYVYTMGFMAPAFLSELIVQSMGGAFDEDDDDNYMDDFMVYFFGSQLRTATAMVPFVGPTIQAGINSWNDKWYDDRISTSPAISVLESSVKVPLKVYNAIAEGKNKRGAVKDTLTAVGLATGVPVAPLGRPLGYLIDVEEGKAKPSGVADFMRGLVTGKAGNK